MTGTFRSRPARATRRRVLQTAAAGGAIAATSPFWLNLARAADAPIKIGFSMALTGGARRRRQARPDRHGDLARRHQRQRRPSGSSSRVRLLRRPDPAGQRPQDLYQAPERRRRRSGRLGLRHQSDRARNADRHAQEDGVHEPVRPGRQRAVQVRQILPDHAGRPRTQAVDWSRGFIQLAKQSELADHRAGRRRCRIRQERGGRRACQCPGRRLARSSTTNPIRRARPTSPRSCAPSRRPVPTWSTSGPIRPIPRAWCVRLTSSTCRPRCSAAAWSACSTQV